MLSAPRSPRPRRRRATPNARFFPGFRIEKVKTSGSENLHSVIGGSGAPLLLLHGAPQTTSRGTWSRRDLARITPSSCPTCAATATAASSKATASTTHLLEARHGARPGRGDAATSASSASPSSATTAAAASASPGARSSRPASTALAVLDIVPTYYLLHSRHQASSSRRVLPLVLLRCGRAPVPENEIFAQTRSQFGPRRDRPPESIVRRASRFPASFTRCARTTALPRRSTSSTTEADLNKKVRCPLLVLWRAQGAVTRYDALALWRERAANVSGREMPGPAHSFHETNPEETIAALRAFMA